MASVSSELYPTSYFPMNFHTIARLDVVAFIAADRVHFTQSTDGKDVQVHIIKLSVNGCWATTAEIYAAAMMLQRKLFLSVVDITLLEGGGRHLECLTFLEYYINLSENIKFTSVIYFNIK